jgi:tRNA U34 2-thiouridine synthase MnmA/TrmU
VTACQYLLSINESQALFVQIRQPDQKVSPGQLVMLMIITILYTAGLIGLHIPE